MHICPFQDVLLGDFTVLLRDHTHVHHAYIPLVHTPTPLDHTVPVLSCGITHTHTQTYSLQAFGFLILYTSSGGRELCRTLETKETVRRESSCRKESLYAHCEKTTPVWLSLRWPVCWSFSDRMLAEPSICPLLVQPSHSDLITDMYMYITTVTTCTCTCQHTCHRHVYIYMYTCTHLYRWQLSCLDDSIFH